MKGKKGVIHLALFGVPIGVIIIFLVRLWAANLIIDAVQPELEKALLELGDSIVCPPEFQKDDYQICISGKGEIIVNGKINEKLSLTLSSDQKNDYCSISIGEYVDTKTCDFDEIHKLENFNLILNGMNIKTVVNSKNIENYLFAGGYIKIPIKTWKGFWSVTRYIPK